MRIKLLPLMLSLFITSCNNHEFYPDENIDHKTQYLEEMIIYVGAEKTTYSDEHGIMHEAYYYQEKGWREWGKISVKSLHKFKWEKEYLFKLRAGKVKWKGTPPEDYGEEFYIREVLSIKKATGDEIYYLN